MTDLSVISILSLSLEAHDEALNMHRFYAITVGKNLFDLWAIETRYGRKETFGHSRETTKTYMVDTLMEAKAKVSQILKKRLSASRRKGKAQRPPYSLVDIHTPKDCHLSDWLLDSWPDKREKTCNI